ncbi:amidohydrolase family protein [Sporohalobacter salinus]|uniref:amidohydrolase family protein n=1 Tax=Sporohalobacter salinus TaxID=1494606 RepID=UPI00195FA060|nr:amidohydrolase family protein [Sporohalobacter salinus]MBM7624501.1 putative TIM-barrel fold metal-dependent hydrolase [Sporohalobacter salinus]
MIRIIDFHTHAFPDTMADKVVKKLEMYYQREIESQGRLEDLVQEIKESKLYKAVIHVAAVEPERVSELNDWLLEIDSKRLIKFGTIHPGLSDYEAELERLKKNGIKGIKLHPELQQFDILTQQAYDMYEAIGDEFLILFHIGDNRNGYQEDYSSPAKLAQIINDFTDLKVVASHLGGYQMWEQAREHLVGKNLYLDTSSSLDFLSIEEATEIIKAHGVEKVLFGSDFPLKKPIDEIKQLAKLDLSLIERARVLSQNSLDLLAELGIEI